jgi:hypothetical protein
MNTKPTPAVKKRLGRNPYLDGANARSAGLPIEHCPVTPRSRFYKQWRFGWKDRDIFLRYHLG